MESVGWEMRPAGWVLLIILALVLLYLLNQRPQPADDSKELH